MISFDECKALLSQIEGVTFASMDTLTVPVLKGGKANPFQGKVEKLCFGHRVMLFTNQSSNGYLNKVRRELEREGKNPNSFQLSALPWGERIEHSPFIAHKDKHYLQVVFLESGSVEYRAKESIHSPEIIMGGYMQGETIAACEIPGLNERTGAEHQGLEPDDQVIVRTFCLDSILALRAFKEELAA